MIHKTQAKSSLITEKIQEDRKEDEKKITVDTTTFQREQVYF